jgi:uncharacterized protein
MSWLPSHVLAHCARRDSIPALLKLVADKVDWKEVSPASWPNSGQRRNPGEVAEYFAAVGQANDITVFEPREFIEDGENVTVLGYAEGSARDTKQKFQGEWVHIFTVKNSKITRYRMISNTAARYGY